MFFKMYNVLKCGLVLGAVFLGFVSSESEPNAYAPELVALDHRGHVVRSYHGLIKENERTVTLNPLLRAIDRDTIGGASFICGFRIISERHQPFEIVLKNHTSGEAEVVLQKDYNLNTENKNKFRFDIAAYDCGTPSKESEPARVHIHVEEFDQPRWEKTAYIVDVEEGTSTVPFLSVRALEHHHGPTNNICKYEILTPNSPFKIIKDGDKGSVSLKRGEKLSHAERHNYIMAIQATDCAGRVSKPVMVTVKIQKKCILGWKGFPDRIDYSPGSGNHPIAPHANFTFCHDKCDVTKASVSLQLTTKHIGKGCDRDTYSIMSQRKLCGANHAATDLLPPPDRLSSWTKTLPHDDGQASDQIYAFDGQKTAVVVPNQKLNNTLGKHFTIMTWMKHDGENPASRKGEKEHILCNSDGEEMNRHHYSVFTHNCRLVFLFRQEFTQGQMNVFKPAEWRWKIPQVCDNEWHHYAISVDYTEMFGFKVRLYIDGQMFIETKKNPEIIDDWPLHKTRNIHYTQLTVGACWQGGEGKTSQHFKGYLAGMSLLKGKTESDRVIKCLNNCKEKLDFHDIRLLEGGMTVTYNSEMTSITFSAPKISDLAHMIQRVGYINYRLFPTVGRRSLKISTEVTCRNGVDVNIPDFMSSIIVMETNKPKIELSGNDRISRKESELLHSGEKIFSDLEIVVEKDDALKTQIAKDLAKDIFKSKVFAEGKDKIKTKKDSSVKLDSCMIRTFPAMTSEEHLIYPQNLINQLGLLASANSDGLAISGVDNVHTYEEVLHHIHYLNRAPEKMNTRKFTLTCSDMNGRFVSNEHIVILDVIHKLHQPKDVAGHAQKDVQYHIAGGSKGKPHDEVIIPFKEPHVNYHSAPQPKDYIDNVSSGGSNAGTAVIIVICVGFLISMIIVGVIRIRAAHQRSQVVSVNAEQEMEWDNSALTITVNPMEEQDGFNDFDQNVAVINDDSDSDDSEGSYHDDIESSEEEADTKTVKDSQLEWDDSTLTF